MAWALGTFAAILFMAWLVADKEKIEEETRKTNRWAKPFFYFSVALAIFLFVIYPHLV